MHYPLRRKINILNEQRCHEYLLWQTLRTFSVTVYKHLMNECLLWANWWGLWTQQILSLSNLHSNQPFSLCSPGFSVAPTSRSPNSSLLTPGKRDGELLPIYTHFFMPRHLLILFLRMETSLISIPLSQRFSFLWLISKTSTSANPCLTSLKKAFFSLKYQSFHFSYCTLPHIAFLYL